MGKEEQPARPVVGIPTSLIYLPEHSIPQHGIGDRYIRAVRDASGADPLLIPALADATDYSVLAGRLDGLFLTGGRANVEPHHYGGPPFPEGEFRDPARDNTTLPLIRACIDSQVPIFGVCRGLQEMNVALGGTLHYRVHMLAGKLDHRMPKQGDMDSRFALAHDIALAGDGEFARLIGDTAIKVNSAHGQGVDRLAPGLVIEAKACDGIIEGIRVPDCGTFAVGVQWHAEHRWAEHRLSSALFKAFGRAARQRAARRLNGG
jgi:putative glutamine amidotransferase